MNTRALLASAILVIGTATAHGQFLGNGPRDSFHDTSILRPPTGSKVAIIVFEDLECPACARAHPFEIEAAKQTHVVVVRHDFPLPQHVWAFQAAMMARYIQDKINSQLADQYRSDVFTAQAFIASKEDLYQFTSGWFQKRGIKMPSTIDSDGTITKEINADVDLGKRLNITFTPTVVVVTPSAYQVVCGTAQGANDPAQIISVVKAALVTVK